MNETVKSLFKQYINITNDFSTFSMINYLKYCRKNHMINIKDRRIYLNVYLETLKSYRDKKNVFNLKTNKSKGIISLADKLISNYEVSV
jgi:hypothetical protein